ncbi:hypothetical protein MMC2321_05303 [Chitinophaga sp. MM2321]
MAWEGARIEIKSFINKVMNMFTVLGFGRLPVGKVF